MSRPVDKLFPMVFGYLRAYSEAIAKLTGITHHWGQDFACPLATSVEAGVDGWWLGYDYHRGYGYMAEVLFSVGALLSKKWYIIRYAHLMKSGYPERFKYGGRIYKKTVIAYSGDTGNTLYADEPGQEPRRHPHLHVEIWEARKVKNAWVRVRLVHPGFVTREEVC